MDDVARLLTRRALLAAGGALANAFCGQALAQGPSPNLSARPVTIVVPFAPGGLADVTARLVAEKLRSGLGTSVVVENRPGAGGIAGARAVAGAAPDGSTLLVANTNLAINPSLYRSLPYDTETAFAPVILALTVPNVIVVRSGLAARNLGELIALARAEPGRLNYASAGSGTFPHLAMALLLQSAGIEMAHIPYNGAAPAMSAILAGQVEVLSSDPPGAMPQIAAGALRPLAVTSSARLAAMPEVPTAVEAGLPGFEAVGWQGFVAPAGTPEPVIRALNAAITAALAAPDVRERLLSQGVAFAPGTPAAFGEFLRRDIERWRGAVAASGARVE
ncbi:tripartite tricarboxylate transporter substrate-binding protein [Roseomonas populi]|uniref:Tripartite tricarboxylate transporter substrate-binding protein n=1 Tax=Roseomonas populi TaxID=3121582 RepID=A0ABT1XCW6_9PROT|nr:tripartite tricarboxylate transporter substrate-binding protein [Roseomonas pecuniae]MCR0985576.1 tripartite tricarboxylate transporter substrate-binding protein [Roseomonas pecuniae]